jgi:hypothetical protein
VCGHLYDDHDVKRDMEPSREAFGMKVEATKTIEQIADEIAAMLDTEAPPFPDLGACFRCSCSDYRAPEQHADRP